MKRDPSSDGSGRSTGIARLAIVTAFATFLLIIAGGAVTSTGSGLAVPDWPLSFGRLVPAGLEGGEAIEFGHRAVAGAVGILTIALAIWIAMKEERRWVRMLALVAVPGVMAQAVLGGLNVLWERPVAIRVTHAAVAQSFFCLIVVLAIVTGRSWIRGPRESTGLGKLPALSMIATAAVFAQLFLGAILRHTDTGLLLHIIGAAFVTVLSIVLALRLFERCPDEPRLRLPGVTLVILIVVQLALGGLALAARDSAWVTTAHVAIGALILVTVLQISIWSHRLGSGAEDREPRPLADGSGLRANLEGASV